MLTSMQIENKSISRMVLGSILSLSPKLTSVTVLLHCTFASTASQIQLEVWLSLVHFALLLKYYFRMLIN